jgi:hypothetical protein
MDQILITYKRMMSKMPFRVSICEYNGLEDALKVLNASILK